MSNPRPERQWGDPATFEARKGPEDRDPTYVDPQSREGRLRQQNHPKSTLVWLDGSGPVPAGVDTEGLKFFCTEFDGIPAGKDSVVWTRAKDVRHADEQALTFAKGLGMDLEHARRTRQAFDDEVDDLQDRYAAQTEEE